MSGRGSKAADQLWDKLRIVNGHDVSKLAQELGLPGQGVYVDYQPAGYGRGATHSGGWVVWQAGYMTRPDGPWYEKNARFEPNQLEGALAWAAGRYGVTEWSRIPGLGRARFPKEVADEVKRRLKEAS